MPTATRRGKKLGLENYMCGNCNKVTEHSVERAPEDDSDVLTCLDCSEPIGDMSGFNAREQRRAEWSGTTVEAVEEIPEAEPETEAAAEESKEPED